MVPWGAIIRAVVIAVLPRILSRLNDPNIVNKMSNNGVIRGLARQAVKLQLKYEKVLEEYDQQQSEQIDQGNKSVKPEEGQKSNKTNKSSRTYVRQTAEKLKKPKK